MTMEIVGLMIGSLFGLVVVLIITTVITSVYGYKAYLTVLAMERSTHQIQMVPLELPEDEDSPDSKFMKAVEKGDDPELSYDDYLKKVEAEKKKWKEKIHTFHTEDEDSLIL